MRTNHITKITTTIIRIQISQRLAGPSISTSLPWQLVLRPGRGRLFPRRKNRPSALHSPLHATWNFALGSGDAELAIRQVFQVHSIESESRRMGLLIDDLLLLARLDAQRPIERKLVDLLALATDAVHDARAVSPNRTISIEVVDGPGTPEVLGDEARLRQVLGNLMTNALQHTPETADIIVRVGTNAEDAILEVVDEGPGMSREDALRVFERFYRTDSLRARSSGGSGLGLSIVDSLVHAHGGTVNVTSVLGQGCHFYVSLPRVADVPARAGSARR